MINEALSKDTSILKEIFKQYLEREPTEEDFCKGKLIPVEGNPDKCAVTYEGIKLGTLERKYAYYEGKDSMFTMFIPATITFQKHKQ